MPAPWRPRVIRVGGRTQVLHGPHAIFDIPDEDTTLRNFAMVAMTESGVMAVKEAGAAFGVRADHVSRLRSGYCREGPAALVAKRPGRPPALSPGQVRQAQAWAAQRVAHAEIARRLGVPRSVVTETLRRCRGPAGPAESLFGNDCGGEGRQDPGGDERGLFDEDGDGAGEGCGGDEFAWEDCDHGDGDEDGREGDGAECGLDPAAPAEAGAGPGGGAGARAGATLPAAGARIEAGVFSSRFAGAMLVWAYTHRVGAQAVLATAAGSGPAGVVFDDVGVLAAVLMAFSLGRVSIEQFKCLPGGRAGPLVGWDRLPSLRALRPRLAAIADAVDPVALLGATSAPCWRPTRAAPGSSTSMTTSSPTPGASRSRRGGTTSGAAPSGAASTP
jgi:hypothetical protein